MIFEILKAFPFMFYLNCTHIAIIINSLKQPLHAIIIYKDIN